MSIAAAYSALRRLALGAPVLVLGFAAPIAPAEAQIYIGPWGPRTFSVPMPGYGPVYREPRERRMHPAMIVDDLEERGFRDLVVVARRPDVYVIEGFSARREPVRLVVDAFDGEILERFSRGPAQSAALPPAPLPTPPTRRTTEAPPKASPAPKVAGPLPLPAPQSAPAVPGRPRSSDWAPINSVPVAPLE